MLTTNLQEGSETFSDEPLLQYEITSISLKYK